MFRETFVSVCKNEGEVCFQVVHRTRLGTFSRQKQSILTMVGFKNAIKNTKLRGTIGILIEFTFHVCRSPVSPFFPSARYFFDERFSQKCPQLACLNSSYHLLLRPFCAGVRWGIPSPCIPTQYMLLSPKREAAQRGKQAL